MHEVYGWHVKAYREAMTAAARGQALAGQRYREGVRPLLPPPDGAVGPIGATLRPIDKSVLFCDR